ncbi:Imm21 family immunity protein [Streptomyces erythrochromogenes]|uniref:Imm21 family immunity protein n=1 Tax=Streptomyces erythrochromogenes TaxID=285574 RepID=UPI00343F447A
MIAVGGAGGRALGLADEPATTCCLPECRAFLRRPAADSAAAPMAAAEARGSRHHRRAGTGRHRRLWGR